MANNKKLSSTKKAQLKKKANVLPSQVRKERKTLTSRELERQDFVDGLIFDLINNLVSSSEQVDWDIEMIGDIRDRIQYWLVEHYEITNEQDFYPYIPE